MPLAALFLAYAAAAGAWLDVPFVAQEKAGCGSASVAMVMQYWAAQDPAWTRLSAEAERIAHLAPPSAKGFTGSDLQKQLEGAGFIAFVFRGELRDLDDHLRKGRPVIVCFGPSGSDGPLHFAVVAGLDAESVLLNDPTRGKLFRESLRQFLPAWRTAGNWSLLAVPRPAR